MNITDTVTIRINRIIESNKIEIKDQQDFTPNNEVVPETSSDFAIVNANIIALNKKYKTLFPLNLRLLHEFTHIKMSKYEHSRNKVLNPLETADSLDFFITFFLMTLRSISLILSNTKYYKNRIASKEEAYADCVSWFIYLSQILTVIAQKSINIYFRLSEISITLLWVYLIFFFNKPIKNISIGIILTIAMFLIINIYFKYDKKSECKYSSLFELI